MPVKMVRNLKSGPTVWSSLEKRRSLEWQGAGDPSGLDIQPVDEEILAEPSFQQALRKKIFEIVDDETGAAALDAQSQAREAAQQNIASSIASTIDRSQEESFVVAKCQGPATRGTGECGEDVTRKATEIDDAPLLCPAHANLAHLFMEEETGEMVERDGKLVSRKAWRRTSVGAA